MEIIFLDAQVVMDLQAQQLELTPEEPPGVLNAGALESAVQAPQNSFHYDGISDIHHLAAIYIVRIARNHPFVSANKRAAMAAGAAFLRLNGFTFSRDDEALGELIIRVLAHEAEIEDLRGFLASNSEPIG